MNTMDELISKQAVIEIVEKNHTHDITLIDGDAYTEGYRDGIKVKESDILEDLIELPTVEHKRIWYPCSEPPIHHRNVIVKGVEAISNKTVHKVMQWDVDRWRPTDYAPSIMWKEWSEIEFDT